LVHPDRAFFARLNPLTPETMLYPTFSYCRYARCTSSGMSVLLTPKGVVSGFVLGRFPTTGLFLSLVEISTAS
jgi:hypothetical protein